MIEPKILRPFKRLCVTIGAIPTSYMESMTYYEMLEWLCKYLSDTVIPAINSNAEAVKECQDLYLELKDYVDHYFDNLDIQAEVDAKLDDMAEQGQLTDIIAQYLQLAGILAYNTKADMKGAENLVNGSFAKTYGGTTYNDGNGHFYKIRTLTSGDTVDDVNIIALTNYPTLIAELMTDNDIINLNNKIGNLSNLTTSHKTNLVSAINEINENDGIPVIFDGDLATDVDDYIGLRLLDWANKNKNIKTLGVMVSVYNKDTAPAINAMMKFDEVDEVPIGYDSSKSKTQSSSYLSYMTKYPHGIAQTDDCEDAVTLYRKLLTASDKKVRIICTGYLLNIANLMRSVADDISSKTGLELVEEKVESIFIMGGKYPSSYGSPEYNFSQDALDAQYVCANSPVRLIFSGFENGNNMRVGLPLLAVDTLKKDILTQAIYYHTYSGSSGSQCWDAMLMLYGIYDNNTDYKFNVVQGTNVVANDGNNTFTVGSGNHYYLQMNQPQSYYISMINNRLWNKINTVDYNMVSEDPVVVGTFKDGRPIYRKYIPFTVGGANQSNYVNIGAFDKIINYSGGFVNSGGDMWPLPVVNVSNSSVIFMSVWFDKTNSRMVEEHNYTYPNSKSAYVIIDYVV